MALNLEALNRFAKTFKNGEIIFTEFELGNNFYLIKEGQVELIKIDGDTEKTLTILPKNEMFGEMAILEKSPRSATAIAHGNCVLLEFNSTNFQGLMEGLPEMALKLLKSFIGRLYESRNKYKILTRQDPEERIAVIFVQLDAEQLSTAADESRTFDISVGELARRAGMSEDQTHKVLDKLILEKRVSFYKGKLVVSRIAYFKNYIKNLQSRTY